MTDWEILMSKIQHKNDRFWLRVRVCAGAPSRLCWMFNANGERLGLWDFANERPYRKPRRRK